MAAYEESEMFSTPFEFETAEPSSATILRELAAQRLLIESLRAEIGELRALLMKPSGPTIRLSRRPAPVIDIDEDDERAICSRGSNKLNLMNKSSIRTATECRVEQGDEIKLKFGSVEALEKGILEDERVHEKGALQKQWEILEEAKQHPTWMEERGVFLGIRDAKNILDIHVDDLPKKIGPEVKLLSVCGVACLEDVAHMADLCISNEISYFRIVNSSCDPEILETIQALLDKKKPFD